MEPVRERLNSNDFSRYLPNYVRVAPQNKISCLSHSILIEKESESSEEVEKKETK